LITIVDYGLGNLSSIKNMLRRLGHHTQISSDQEIIGAADKLILPGVGAFDNGMRNIRSKGLEEVLRRKALGEQVPILGICLGMQLLFEGSEEGTEKGLGWIKGRAVRFKFDPEHGALKVPHMGWNLVTPRGDSPLVQGFLPDMRFYFVHSYHVICDDPSDVLLTADYGLKVVAAVRRGNIMGTQFHPEKSHKYGMILLQNFAKM